MCENMSYGDIVKLEVEISSFSGEGFKVKYDFRRNLISWNDGYMWSNNFMKSINPVKMKMLEDELPDTTMLEWMHAYNIGQEETVGKKTANPSSWEIEVTFANDQTLKSGCLQHFPTNWDSLRSLIENTTECSFHLR